jgi:hypothetical protein
MRSDPLDVPIALRIGKGTLRKMRQNLGWAIGYNAVALPIAAGVFEPAFGLVLRPEIAALSMSGSSLLVAVNALLLKRLQLPAPAGPEEPAPQPLPTPIPVASLNPGCVAVFASLRPSACCRLQSSAMSQLPTVSSSGSHISRRSGWLEPWGEEVPDDMSSRHGGMAMDDMAGDHERRADEPTRSGLRHRVRRMFLVMMI